MLILLKKTLVCKWMIKTQEEEGHDGMRRQVSIFGYLSGLLPSDDAIKIWRFLDRQKVSRFVRVFEDGISWVQDILVDLNLTLNGVFNVLPKVPDVRGTYLLLKRNWSIYER